MSQVKAKERRFTARVVLLSLARNADQMAEKYEQSGQIQLSQQADRQAYKLYKAIEEQESDDAPEATAEELKTTLTDILDLTDESKALIEEALGEEAEHEEADAKEEKAEDEDPEDGNKVPENEDGEEIPPEGFDEPSLPFASALRPKLGSKPIKATKPVTPPQPKVPARRGYRIQAIR